MAALFGRIKAFLRSPQGRQATEKAKQLARDPRTRQKAREAVSRLKRRR